MISVSGAAVDPSVVELTKWIAEHWFGPRRAVLASASSPRLRARPVVPRRGAVRSGVDDPVARATEQALRKGGGLVMVPPLASALSAIEVVARRGPIIVSCPTKRMVRLGAASLRRRGLTTAELPDEWDAARSGVDVVIGARSAVLGACRDLAGMVVIDEHDEAMKEERSPAWDALAVASRRCGQAGIPLVATSAVPSAQALTLFGESIFVPQVTEPWPSVLIENLDDLSVKGSLLGTALLDLVATQESSVGCIVSAKGGARLLACTTCRRIQVCERCSAALTRKTEGTLHCASCASDVGSVCVSCGRTGLAVLRGGTSHFRDELSRSTGRTVHEISTDAPDDWVEGRVFVGTEAVLRRMGNLDAVVFVDADRDLSVGSVNAPRDFLSKVAQAARMVGRSGRVVVQTRQPSHPVLTALASDLPAVSILDWLMDDLESRKLLDLPPYSSVARISTPEGVVLDRSVLEGLDVEVAERGDNSFVRAHDREVLRQAIDAIRLHHGAACRVHVDPWRY